MTPRLILILGDQLTDSIAALRAADPARDIVVMAEVMAEGSYVPHHPQKIALILTAMRKFAAQLRAGAGACCIPGWRILKPGRRSRPNCCAGRRKPGRRR